MRNHRKGAYQWFFGLLLGRDDVNEKSKAMELPRIFELEPELWPAEAERIVSSLWWGGSSCQEVAGTWLWGSWRWGFADWGCSRYEAALVGTSHDALITEQ